MCLLLYPGYFFPFIFILLISILILLDSVGKVPSNLAQQTRSQVEMLGASSWGLWLGFCRSYARCWYSSKYADGRELVKSGWCRSHGVE